MIALLPLLVLALALPAAAQAKVTCEEPQRPAPGVPMRGLPSALVAGRTYLLTATLPPAREGANPAPHLGAEHCGDDVPHESTAGAGGWFRRVPGSGGSFALELRLPSAGPWAMSFMDREGRFHELGIRTVLPSSGFWPVPKLWVFEDPAAMSPRSTAPFPAPARTSGW